MMLYDEGKKLNIQIWREFEHFKSDCKLPPASKSDGSINHVGILGNSSIIMNDQFSYVSRQKEQQQENANHAGSGIDLVDFEKKLFDDRD